MRIKRRSDVEASRVVIFDSGNARLEDMAGFPKLGTFIHVFVKPLVANRKMKLLNEKCQLGVKGSEK